MARQISISEAKADFYRLAASVVAGEEIIITKRGKVKARLSPLDLPKTKKLKSRRG